MWIDIENSDFVEDTLSIYLEILRKNRNAGGSNSIISEKES